MALLWVGGFVAGYIVPLIPQATGFFALILAGVIQIVIVGLFGALGKKLDLYSVVVGALVIFVGAMIGSYLATTINITGLFSTVVILAIQTLLLSMMGIIKGGFKAKI